MQKSVVEFPRITDGRTKSGSNCVRGIRGNPDIIPIIKALSHPSRLQLVAVLLEGELSVNRLQYETGQPLAALSQSLANLHSANLLNKRREGRLIIYGVCQNKRAWLVQLLGELLAR